MSLNTSHIQFCFIYFYVYLFSLHHQVAAGTEFRVKKAAFVRKMSNVHKRMSTHVAYIDVVSNTVSNCLKQAQLTMCYNDSVVLDADSSVAVRSFKNQKLLRCDLLSFKMRRQSVLGYHWAEFNINSSRFCWTHNGRSRMTFVSTFMIWDMKGVCTETPNALNWKHRIVLIFLSELISMTARTSNPMVWSVVICGHKGMRLFLR